VNAISRIRPADRFLPWDDVLHAGPVPGELSLEKLSAIRSRFIWRCGWGDLDHVTRKFEQRDQTLLSAHEQFDELLLWFEHDLYDQLQLIQVLAVLGEHRPIRESGLPITIICHDHFVGMSDIEILTRDYRDRAVLRREQIELATEAWAAFTSFTPLQLESFYHTANMVELTYLRDAIGRWFEEFPSAYDGLTSTERTVLHFIAEGVRDAVELFARVQEVEEAPFLGDSSFWRVLGEMSADPANLISMTDGGRYDPRDGAGALLKLTDLGEQALSGIAVPSSRLIDRWMGGTHLRPGNSWYWDHIEQCFQNDLLVS